MNNHTGAVRLISYTFICVYLLVSLPAWADNMTYSKISECELWNRYEKSLKIYNAASYDWKLSWSETDILKNELLDNDLRITEALKLINATEALSAYNSGDPGPAEELFNKQLETVRKKSPAAAEAHFNLGNLEFSKVDLKAALEHYESAYNIMHDNTKYMVAMGRTLNDLFDYKASLKHLKKALDMDKKALGPDHPTVAVDLNAFGLALYESGEFYMAMECFEEAIRIWSKAKGRDNADVVFALKNIAITLDHIRQYEKAIEYYEQAMYIDKKLSGGKPTPVIAADLYNIGEAWFGLAYQIKNPSFEYYEKAIGYFEQAIEMWKATSGEDTLYISAALDQIGMAWLFISKDSNNIKREAYVGQAVKHASKCFDKSHPLLELYDYHMPYKPKNKSDE